MSEEKRFEDREDDPNSVTKLRSPPRPQQKQSSKPNESSEEDRKRKVGEEKERIKQKIADVCENLELGQAKDVAELPAIEELCGLLKELAIQSDLRLDNNNIQQDIQNFTCLIKLMEVHRHAGCNTSSCFKISNCLLKASGYDTDQYSCTDASISQAQLLNELGSLFLAPAQFEKSIPIAEQLAKMTNELGDQRLEAEAYLILFRSNLLKGSLEAMQQNLNKYLECSAKSGDELSKGYEAMCSSHVFLLSEKNEDALKKAEKFLAIAKSLQNRKVECEAMRLLALIHSNLFNMQKSLDFYSEGLKIAEELKHKGVIAWIKLNKASVYLVIGNYYKAYSIISELHSKQNDTELEDKLFSFGVLTNLSVSALLLNKDEESFKLAKESLALAQTIEGSGKRLAIAYGNVGLVHEKLKKYSDAIESFKECLKHGIRACDNRTINNGYCNLGRAYEGKGDKTTARQYYQKALETSQPLSTHWCDTEAFRFSADYLLAKMEVSEEKPNFSKARAHLEKVVQRCESFRKSVNDSPLKICFNDTQNKPYQLLQYVLLKEEAKDEALLVGEKGRGRDFYDTFVRDEGEQSRYLDTPQELLKISKDKNEAILFLSQLEIVKQICGWFIAPDGKIAGVFLSPIDKWDKALTSLCCAMKEYDLQTQSKNLVEEKQGEKKQDEEKQDEKKQDEKKQDEKKQVTECRGIKVDDDEIDVVSVTSEKFTQQLAERVSTRRPPGLNHNDSPSSQVDPLLWFSEVIDNLSELVVRPIDHLLEKLFEKSTEKPQLLIIPQGKTFNIPFAALKLKDKQPLCSRVSTHEAFSFHSYLHCTKLNQEPQMQAKDSKEILIIGNPTEDLPFATKEAETLAKELGVSPESCMIGPSATRTNVVDRLPHASLIHFACHGTTDGRKLLLAPEENQMSVTDSHLDIKQISRLTITAKLVVLSACHTARGQISSEGVLGLARAFLIAGAKSVVTALWAIPDEATEAFMVKFYKNLAKMPVCDALSTTMCQMRTEKSFEHVVHWGSFKILGANVSVSLPSKTQEAGESEEMARN